MNESRFEGAQPYAVRAVGRAIELLKAFTQERPELSLRELAHRTDLPKATAFRLLATLQAGGLVSQNSATGDYSLGSEIAALAAIRARQSELLDRVLPVMRRIRDEVNETTSLAIRVGDYRVHLYQLESLKAFRRTTEIGDRAPLYAGAANRVLLAAMDDSEIDAYLNRTQLTPFTETTPTNAAAVWEAVQRTRQDGYAESYCERHPGGVGVAAPVKDPSGAVVAVIYVSVPESRYVEPLSSACVAAVTSGAAELSAELGYRDHVTV